MHICELLRECFEGCQKITVSRYRAKIKALIIFRNIGCVVDWKGIFIVAVQPCRGETVNVWARQMSLVYSESPLPGTSGIFVQVLDKRETEETCFCPGVNRAWCVVLWTWWLCQGSTLDRSLSFSFSLFTAIAVLDILSFLHPNSLSSFTSLSVAVCSSSSASATQAYRIRWLVSNALQV